MLFHPPFCNLFPCLVFPSCSPKPQKWVFQGAVGSCRTLRSLCMIAVGPRGFPQRQCFAQDSLPVWATVSAGTIHFYLWALESYDSGFQLFELGRGEKGFWRLNFCYYSREWKRWRDWTSNQIGLSCKKQLILFLEWLLWRMFFSKLTSFLEFSYW